MYIFMYIHIYINIYIYTHTQTQTHAHTHPTHRAHLQCNHNQPTPRSATLHVEYVFTYS